MTSRRLCVSLSQSFQNKKIIKWYLFRREGKEENKKNHGIPVRITPPKNLIKRKNIFFKFFIFKEILELNYLIVDWELCKGINSWWFNVIFVSNVNRILIIKKSWIIIRNFNFR